MEIEALEPLTIRLPGGKLRELRPGEPVTLPAHLGEKLLARVGGKVRVVSCLPVLPHGCLIYWRGADGHDRGPAVIEDVVQDERHVHWVRVEYEGQMRWISERILQRVDPPSSSRGWYLTFHALVEWTTGITKDDPRFLKILDLLGECDAAYHKDDWPRFQERAGELKRLLETSR